MNEKSADLFFAAVLFAIALFEWGRESRRLARTLDNVTERISDYAD